MSFIFLVLFLFQIKHWYIDFVDQTNEEVAHKGIYLHWLGMKHSLKHGIATAAIVLLLVVAGSTESDIYNFGFDYTVFAAILGFLDFITHYHIDWCKMNFGNRDIRTPAFWNHLGLDQMAHQIVYIYLAYLIL